MCGRQPCYAHTTAVVSRVLLYYGEMVGRHPLPFILLPLAVFAGLGASLPRVEWFDNTDQVDLLRNSRTLREQAIVQRLFPDRTANKYDAVELSEDQIMAIIIFQARDNSSVYDPDVLSEIRQTLGSVKQNVTARVGNVTYTYEKLCGKRDGACVVTGERLLSPQFDTLRKSGLLTYPKWRLPNNETVDFSFALADADSKLRKARVVRVTFKLRHDLTDEAYAWESAFVEFVKRLEPRNTNIAFSTSQSFRQERQHGVNADLPSLWAALATMTACAWLVTVGGDLVSTRALMLIGGIIPPAMGSVSAAVLLSFCGIKLVHFVHLAAVLVLGISLNITFLLMSCWSETIQNTELTVPQRLGVTLSHSGVGIAIASLSVSVSLAIAYTSDFIGLSSLCLFVGLAVFVTFICHMTLQLACMALHGRRVYSSRHALTCLRTKARDVLRREGRRPCHALFCGGSVPSKHRADESPLERVPRKTLISMEQSLAIKVTTMVIFLGVTAVAIYGVTKLKEGVSITTLVPRSSYFFTYMTMDAAYFGFSFPVAFIFDDRTEYNLRTAQKMEDLLQKAREDRLVEDEFVRCWLTDFVKSPFFSVEQAGGNFILGTVQDFLINTSRFLSDVVFDETGQHLIASRCFVFSEKTSDQHELASFMQRMRGLAESSDLPVFVFHPSFLSYEQFLSVLPTTLQTVGIAAAVLCVVHGVFLPHPLVTAVVVINMLSSMVDVLGFMTLWGVTLSSDTMVHVILSVVVAVNFATHVCTAFLTSNSGTRSKRALHATSCAAVPLFNFGMSSLVGLLVLLSSHSYLLETFFKVILLVLAFGVFNGVFFTTAVLALVGPENLRHLTNSSQQKGQEQFTPPLDSPSNRIIPNEENVSGFQNASNTPKLCEKTSNEQNAAEKRFRSRTQDQINRHNFTGLLQQARSITIPRENVEEAGRSTPYYVPVLPPRLGYPQEMLGTRNEFENIIRYHKHEPDKTGLLVTSALQQARTPRDHMMNSSHQLRSVYTPAGTPSYKPHRQVENVASGKSFFSQSFNRSGESLERVGGIVETLSKKGSLASTQTYILEMFKDGRGQQGTWKAEHFRSGGRQPTVFVYDAIWDHSHLAPV